MKDDNKGKKKSQGKKGAEESSARKPAAGGAAASAARGAAGAGKAAAAAEGTAAVRAEVTSKREAGSGNVAKSNSSDQQRVNAGLKTGDEREERKSYKRRVVTSNWSRYEQDLEQECNETETRGADYSQILLLSSSVKSEYQFRGADDLFNTEMMNDKSCESVLSLDCESLGTELLSIPLHTRLNIEAEIFEADQLRRFKDEACEHAANICDTRVSGAEQTKHIKILSDESSSQQQQQTTNQQSTHHQDQQQQRVNAAVSSEEKTNTTSTDTNNRTNGDTDRQVNITNSTEDNTVQTVQRDRTNSDTENSTVLKNRTADSHLVPRCENTLASTNSVSSTSAVNHDTGSELDNSVGETSTSTVLGEQSSSVPGTVELSIESIESVLGVSTGGASGGNVVKSSDEKKEKSLQELEDDLDSLLDI